MSTLSGVNYAKTIAVPADKIDPGQYNCRLKLLYDSHVYAAALQTGDYIYGPMIPEGAFIVDAFIHATTGGGAGVLKLGHLDGINAVETADTDSLVDNCDISGGAVLGKADITCDKLFKSYSEQTRMAVYVTTGTTSTSGTVKFGIVYSLES